MEGRKEGFASRWSRRKQEVAKEAEREHHNHADNDVKAREEIASEDVIIDEATLAKQRLEKLNALTDDDMPDIETLNEDSDFSGFMSTGVSEALRKMALQKLFHGKTYNIRDGLDEYDGDYTSFEKLDPNIITCDMKHILDVEAEKLLAKEEQEKAEQLAEIEANINEAENQEDALDELDKQALLTEQEIGEQNKDMKENIADVAYAAVEKLNPASTSVVEYQSRGHVVIIGDSEALESFGDLPKNLSSEVVEYKGNAPSDDISITGALGKFHVNIAEQVLKADLVLDLSPEPLLTMGLKPPGYVAVGSDATNIQGAKDELAEMVGTFEKPKYFNYDASACAHGRSGKPGCTRCIDACPAEAITSLIDTIKVDASRCQGAASAPTVCPSGAITYAYPKPKDLLTHVRTLILTYLKEGLADGVAPPDLIFVTEAEQSQAEHLLPAGLVITVEEVASVGPEIWLSALAWGAKSVRIFDLGDTGDLNGAENSVPKSARAALDLHLEMTQEILKATGYPANVVSVISDPSELITVATMPIFDLATHSAITGKRQSFFMALDHLVTKSEQVEPVTSLPQGSIFGEIAVNKDNCTLCMACVSACPANALQDGSEKPMLGFVETNCLQCGVCVTTCPEEAITMSPRLLLDREQRRKPRVLNEEEPFCCISCGKPFATKSGITTILEKLSGHSMFADERSKNRLKMCDDCRVRDMMEDPSVDF